MPNRVTITEVKEIMEIDETVVTDAKGTVMIGIANMMVTNNLDSATLETDDNDLTDAELKEIERYLSAHLISLMDKRIASESVDVISISYQHRVDLGLDQTAYGQMVKILDRTGTLASLGSTKKTYSIYVASPASSTGLTDDAEV